MESGGIGLSLLYFGEIKRRYDETIEPRKPVRLKDALGQDEVVQGIRRSNVVKRRSKAAAVKTGIVINTKRE